MRRASLVLAGMLLGACAKQSSGSVASTSTASESRYPRAEGVPGCSLYGEPRPTGQPPANPGRVPLVLAEMSGLAASFRHPGVFWSHNDSGNAFQVFALDAQGSVLATLTLTGVDGKEAKMDLEDIALGPCSRGDQRSCLFLGDIGDNFARRSRLRIFRLPEPEALADATLPVETLSFTYPDKPHDAESLILEPRTGRLAVITKERDSLGLVYALDGLAPDSVTKATRLGELRSPGDVDFRTTAADLHESGQRLLLRTYTRVWEVRAPGATRLEELVKGQVAEVPGPSQAQSEAITFLPGGRAYLLGSEFAGQLLYRVDCR